MNNNFTIWLQTFNFFDNIYDFNSIYNWILKYIYDFYDIIYYLIANFQFFLIIFMILIQSIIEFLNIFMIYDIIYYLIADFQKIFDNMDDYDWNIILWWWLWLKYLWFNLWLNPNSFTFEQQWQPYSIPVFL